MERNVYSEALETIFSGINEVCSYLLDLAKKFTPSGLAKELDEVTRTLIGTVGHVDDQIQRARWRDHLAEAASRLRKLKFREDGIKSTFSELLLNPISGPYGSWPRLIRQMEERREMLKESLTLVSSDKRFVAHHSHLIDKVEHIHERTLGFYAPLLGTPRDVTFERNMERYVATPSCLQLTDRERILRGVEELFKEVNKEIEDACANIESLLQSMDT